MTKVAKMGRKRVLTMITKRAIKEQGENLVERGRHETNKSTPSRLLC